MSELSNDEIRLKIAQAKGWRVVSHPGGFWAILAPHMQPADGAYVWPSEESAKKAAHPFGKVNNWPTDIRAAWELVEEVGELHWSVTIENLPDRPQEVVARIFIPFSGPCFMGSGSTAPRAISLAYLEYLAWKGLV